MDRLVIGRLISLIENHDANAFKILSEVFPSTGCAFRIGITGFPGAGKSTLINRLAKFFLDRGKSCGVILVDPTSPLTGGALLGDRIRMKDIQVHPKIFIRSMATRGKLGGLAATSRQVADLFDGIGFDVVILETVGVGQLELDIAGSSHLTCVMLTPESGDEVQALKAGLMEIAHLFIVNKMDRDPQKLWFRRLQNSLQITYEEDQRKKPILFPVSALHGEGLEAVFEFFFDAHKKFSREKKPVEVGAEKFTRDVETLLGELFTKEVLSREAVKKKIENYLSDALQRRKSPYEVAKFLLRSYVRP